MRRWLAVPMALTVVALVWLLGRQVGMAGWLAGGAAVAATLVLAWWTGRRQAQGKVAGLPMLLMAALVVPVSLALPQAMQRDVMQLTDDSLLDAEPWSAARVAALRTTGKPLFVYFTADWCVSCKVNEASSIDRAETARAFEASRGQSVDRRLDQCRSRHHPRVGDTWPQQCAALPLVPGGRRRA